MSYRIATDETKQAIKARRRELGSLSKLARALGVNYSDLYDVINDNPMSVARENQVRYWLDLAPLEPEPRRRIEIDPTRQAVRALPGHGNTPYRTMSVKLTSDDYERVREKLALGGYKSLSDFVHAEWL